MNLIMKSNKTQKLISTIAMTLIIFTLFKNSYDNIYTSIISNSVPTIDTKEKDKFNIFNNVLYILTQLDLSNNNSIVYKSVPLIRGINLYSGYDESKYILGLSKFKNNQKISSDDYFDKSSEIEIDSSQIINDNIMFSDYKSIDNSYILKKLINFEKNLNINNQAMDELNIISLLNKEFKFNKVDTEPKILIFHTHASEKFKNEAEGSNGIVDVGARLKEVLENKYNIPTMHCLESFDTVDNKVKINGSYERMEPRIKKILKENPSIELVIDLHRDGIDDDIQLLTDIKGEKVAKIMFVNGLCKIQKDGVLTPIQSLPSDYVEDNIALSTQLQLKGNEAYPGFMRKILVKPYRYSLHMKPMSLLIEVGAQNNTKEEAMNAMEPLAEILMSVIKKD